MNTLTMNELQQSGQASWRLAPGQSSTLKAAGDTRWLRVCEGKLWVTTAGRLGVEIPDDAWLQPGEVLELPAGVSAVLEGWPQASFQVLEAAPGTAPRQDFDLLRGAARLAADFLGGLAARARSAASSPSRAHGAI